VAGEAVGVGQLLSPGGARQQQHRRQQHPE
jgi:hypothetical protein